MKNKIYINLLWLIETLENSLKENMSGQYNGDALSSTLDKASRNDDYGDPKLSRWLYEMSSEFTWHPLAGYEPRSEAEIEAELLKYNDKIRSIIRYLEGKLPDIGLKTNHSKVVSQLITVLEQAEHDDVSLSPNRQLYVSAMYDAYKEIPLEEQELVDWLLSQSDVLEAAPLAKDDPAHAGEIEQYRGKIRRMVKYLKSTLPDSPKPEEYRNTLCPS